MVVGALVILAVAGTPLPRIEDEAEQVETLDKVRPVALYCRSGRRSKLAAEQVVQAGFEVVELNGGILSWQGETVQ